MFGVLQYCPGYIHIVYSTLKHFQEQYQNTYELRLVSDPHSIIIIFPWSLEILNMTHYFELDASFKGMKPYKYCVSQAIFFNESIPLSISVAPQENEELYQSIFDVFNILSENNIDWKTKSVLSDMGKAIISTCKKFGVNHYFCHRHLIEHFNPKSVLGIYARKLLKCFNVIEYENLRSQILKELDEYEKERKELGTFTIIYAKKSNDLRIMLSGEKAPKDSNYYFKKWALWERVKSHVGRCSNHSEGFHNAVNISVGKKKNIIKKMSNLIEVTVKHAENFPSRQGSSIKRKRTKIIEKLLRKLNIKTFDIFSVCQDECTCGEDIYNSYIFGCEIQCKHQLLYMARDTIVKINTIIESIKDSDISLNDLILPILTSIKNNPIEEKEIPGITRKLFFKIFNIIEKDLLIQLVDEINSCFIYVFPDYPEFEINYNINEISEEFTNEENNFDEEEEENFTIQKKIPSDEKEFWISKFKNSNEKFAKETLYETIIEVQTIYPKLKNSSIAYSICFDEYNSIINFGNDLDFINSIVKFKISCWKEADKYMKSNKIFTF